MRASPIAPGPYNRGTGHQTPPRILPGNTNDTFIIDEKSGNLTMSKSIPSPMTFTLLVRVSTTDGSPVFP